MHNAMRTIYHPFNPLSILFDYPLFEMKFWCIIVRFVQILDLGIRDEKQRNCSLINLMGFFFTLTAKNYTNA